MTSNVPDNVRRQRLVTLAAIVALTVVVVAAAMAIVR
jgi:hypothetical protein